MMSGLQGRAERLAREAQRREIAAISAQLKGIFGAAAVEAEEARVLVRGRGIIKRWLIDPSLRFLAGGSK